METINQGNTIREAIYNLKEATKLISYNSLNNSKTHSNKLFLFLLTNLFFLFFFYTNLFF